MSYITLNHVSKTLKGTPLLQDISVSINKGDIVALEGINGSGKTLIIRAILGLIKTSGEIKVDSQMVRVGEKYPVKAGILIENPSLIEEFTAFTNLELLAELQEDVTEEDIISLLKEFNLPFQGKQKVKKFSLGMKQKLGIAQALIGNSELIILDEPTNALDQTSIQNLIHYIKKIKSRIEYYFYYSFPRFAIY
ncbi:ATP-binding cassette domain-containing protein [Listeria aquatica]|uniref:ABC transporter ATP-binding protein n=1 Tax=Listeria aquatica FSL S10-1188 TaxID=1265818 RepID=W7AXP7_9LIST|nr:ABC transporter ATP-binding protein [Listeria aquatica]EUJ18402.1 ABC transporter ATP-binding protein [Listeria aquatica FSL S10-1188]